LLFHRDNDSAYHEGHRDLEEAATLRPYYLYDFVLPGMNFPIIRTLAYGPMAIT